MNNQVILNYFIDGEERTEKIRGCIGVHLSTLEGRSSGISIAVVGYGIDTGNTYLLNIYKLDLSYMSGLNKIKELTDKQPNFTLIMKKKHFDSVKNEECIVKN